MASSSSRLEKKVLRHINKEVTEYWECWRIKPLGTVPTINWAEKQDKAWRQTNVSVCGPIRNQKKCNCCWAITTTSLISATRSIKFEDEDYRSFSHQQLIDCCKEKPPNPDVHRCYLYSINKALQWVVKNGLIDEDSLQYIEGKNKNCVTNPDKSFFIKDYQPLKTIDDILEALQHGPVGAAVHVYSEFSDLERNEIYVGPTDVESKYIGQHAVLVVGCGCDAGTNYLLIQSSYGEDWGTNGLAKVDISVMHKPPQKSENEASETRLLIGRGTIPILFSNSEGRPHSNNTNN